MKSEDSSSEEGVCGTESETTEWSADSTDSGDSSTLSGGRRSGVLVSPCLSSICLRAKPFPALYLTPEWTFRLELNRGMEVEIGVCGGVRLVCAEEGVAVTVSSGCGVLAVNSPQMRLVRGESGRGTRGVSQLGPVIVCLGAEGISFGSLEAPGRGYFTSHAALGGTATFAADRADWPWLEKETGGEELSKSYFRRFSLQGPVAKSLLPPVLRAAHHHSSPRANSLHIAGVAIEQDSEGRVLLRTGGPRSVSLRLNPDKGSLHIRLPSKPPPPPPPPTHPPAPLPRLPQPHQRPPLFPPASALAGGAQATGGAEMPSRGGWLWLIRGEGGGFAWAHQKVELRRRWLYVRDRNSVASLSPNAVLTAAGIA